MGTRRARVAFSFSVVLTALACAGPLWILPPPVVPPASSLCAPL